MAFADGRNARLVRSMGRALTLGERPLRHGDTQRLKLLQYSRRGKRRAARGASCVSSTARGSSNDDSHLGARPYVHLGSGKRSTERQRSESTRPLRMPHHKVASRDATAVGTHCG